jgi:F-type H+-transporting ATPase subunit c
VDFFVYSQEIGSVYNLKRALFAVMAFVIAAPAMAQEEAAAPLISFSGPFGAGLIIIGAGLGIGKLAAAAFESMARQPEVSGKIATNMLIAAALIEGVTLFGLIVCML